MLRDLIQLLRLVFYHGIKPVNAKPSRPLNPPPNGPSNGSMTVSKKDRIVELEEQVYELKRNNDNMNDLLVKLAKELSTLQRSVAPLLPEK